MEAVPHSAGESRARDLQPQLRLIHPLQAPGRAESLAEARVRLQGKRR